MLGINNIASEAAISYRNQFCYRISAYNTTNSLTSTKFLCTSDSTTLISVDVADAPVTPGASLTNLGEVRK